MESSFCAPSDCWDCLSTPLCWSMLFRCLQSMCIVSTSIWPGELLYVIQKYFFRLNVSQVIFFKTFSSILHLGKVKTFFLHKNVFSKFFSRCYFSRLYNVQLRGLLALGRFFRGKKWNPLRKRVDHTTSSVDQLFVGSMIFMIFVFLLPTTLTFYAVFATVIDKFIIFVPIIIFHCFFPILFWLSSHMFFYCKLFEIIWYGFKNLSWDVWSSAALELFGVSAL